MKAVDPKNPTTSNKYLYAGDDPVNFNDPTGREFVLVEPGDGSGGGPEWWCSPGDPTCFGDPGSGDPCAYGPDSFAPTPCYSIAAAAAAAAAAAQQQQPPQCSITLETRPVQGIAGRIADHTYLYLQGPAYLFGVTASVTPSETVEGGPTLPGCCGYLYGFVSNPPGGPNALKGTLPGGPQNAQIGPAYTGANACSDIQAITGAVSNYDSSGHWAIYFPVPETRLGYNSNSFTFTLLNDVNLQNYFGQTIPFTPGWGRIVPGL